MFGVLGLCGQRVQPVAAQVLERENDLATALLPKMEVNLAVAQRDKLETAVIDHAQVTSKAFPFPSIFSNENYPFFFILVPCCLLFWTPVNVNNISICYKVQVADL